MAVSRKSLIGCFRELLAHLLIYQRHLVFPLLRSCSAPSFLNYCVESNQQPSPAGLTGPGLCCLVWPGQGGGGSGGEGGQWGGSTAPVLFKTKLESPNQVGWVESTQRPPWKIRASVQHIPPAVDRYELQKSILCPFSGEYVRDGESIQTEELTEQRIPLIGLQPQSRGVL